MIKGSVPFNWTREQRKKKNEILASQIGVSYETLIQAEWEIIEHKNGDGFVGSFTVKFTNTASEILAKIPNIENENEVFISLFVDYDEDYVDYQERCEPLISSKAPHVILYNQIFQLRMLNNLFLEDRGMLQIQKRQLFVAGIGALEIFLQDTIIYALDSNSHYLCSFISTYKPYKEKKISFNSIYIEFEKIKETVKKDLSDIVFHNLGKIKPIFESTFGIEFPSIKEMAQFIEIRHDLVHRNGKQKDNIELDISEKIINDLLSEIMNFANKVTKNLEYQEENQWD